VGKYIDESGCPFLVLSAGYCEMHTFMSDTYQDCLSHKTLHILCTGQLQQLCANLGRHSEDVEGVPVRVLVTIRMYACLSLTAHK